jgi:hypothetical protein
MGNHHRCRGRTAAAAVACAVAVALTLAGCGGDGGDSEHPAGGSTARTSLGAAAPGSGGSVASTPSPEATQVLAQLRGEEDMTVTVNSATRDSGGFVTIKGTITNNGAKAFTAIQWRGTEIALSTSGSSVAGAVLVDPVGRKRYYVLRDTEGKCLCTMGLVGIQPAETRPFFAQFPAPPASTTEVDFEMPTMPPAKIQISEG